MNIGAIARQSGIGVETLRKWEARYGFPAPQRTATGRREYPVETVEQLLSIRCLMAGGARAGKVLREFALRGGQTSAQPGKTEHAEGIAKLIGSDVLGLRQWLLERRNGMTAADFVERVAAPMAREVGVLWADGALPVYAEHLFSEELLSVLSALTETQGERFCPPKILLTAPAGEKHNLGLRMAGAVLASLGERPLYLPADLPNNEIVAAAGHYGVAVVGLSASVSYPPKLLLATLKEIRQELPSSIRLWVGGAGTARLPKLPDHTTQVTDMTALLRLAQELLASDSAMQSAQTT
jgi:DNA-binding transcriptional MerR regulator/methylmalonyl-CoA mutase cobalamin-binding subunit